jgi:hypothetical protein
MTQERARYIIKNSLPFGGLRYAFKPQSHHGQLYADGMTAAEYEAVRALWMTMPGSSSFYTALCEIARQPR